MKKFLVISFICAAGVISCGKKVIPESGANIQSKPVNDKSAKSESQPVNTSATNTNSQDNSVPSFGSMLKTMPSGQPELKSSNLDMGKTIFVTKCNTCHANKNSFDYTKEQMKNILKTEIPKAKLDSKEAEQLTAYLLANTK
jgi:cytochrome c5